MTDRHEANCASFAIDGIDNPKAANTKFPEPIEFTAERFSTLGIEQDRAYRCLDRSFQVWMERTNGLGYMRRNDKLKWFHAVRRFFAGVSGSPKTFSNERPFLRVL